MLSTGDAAASDGVRDDVVRAAMAAAGLDGTSGSVTALGAGLSSSAWRVEAADGPLVVRLDERSTEGAPGVAVAYQHEHAILSALRAAAACVPDPVTGSWDCPGWTGAPFSITRLVPGDPIAGDEASQVVAETAAFLRVLHRVAAPAGTPGLDERFGGPPWPLRRSGLTGHPVLTRPAVAARVNAAASEVRRAIERGPHVLVHSDLHEGNILRSPDGVSFLDLGCAFVGAPGWDYAAIAFFVGGSVAEEVRLRVDDAGAADVRLLALAFALQRWETAADDREEAQHCASFVAAIVTTDGSS